MTWLTFPDIVAAVKASCAWVVSLADSDGLVGVRVHPRETFRRGVFQHRDWLTRMRAAKYWLQRYLDPREPLDEDYLTSAAAADRVAICSARAGEHLAVFYRGRGRPDLVGKIIVSPYPVDDCYLGGEVHADRTRQVVAIGRWDDPQKDAPLLVATLERALARCPGLTVHLIGPGGAGAFAGLARRHPQVRYHGAKPREFVADLLGTSRVLLLTSRWESGPIVANEALCLGCTLVGPAGLPSLASYCRDGGSGTTSEGRSPRALAAALLQEMRAWDEGRRDPAAGARRWRPHFHPTNVCAALLPPARQERDPLPRDLDAMLGVRPW
jgi:glycosyltransferase involved in cell wall biosynthesis